MRYFNVFERDKSIPSVLCSTFFGPKVIVGTLRLRVALYWERSKSKSQLRLGDRRLQIHFLIGNRAREVEISGQTGTGSSFNRHFGLGKCEMPEKCAKTTAKCRNRCTSYAGVDRGSVLSAGPRPEVELIHWK